MKYLKFLFQDISRASRDKKELAAARKAGFDISAATPVQPALELPFPLKVDVLPSRPVLASVPRLKRYVRIIKNHSSYARYLHKQDMDVLSCHDLTALGIGYISNLFKGKKKARLVYDSHEFEMGRNTGGRRGRFADWYIKHTESFLMKRCVLSIIPCDIAAEKTQQIHRLKEKPLVIRNICPYWQLNEEDIIRQRKEFEKAMPALKGRFLLMYHGGVMSGRGIEQLLELVSVNENVCAVILGDGSENYCRALKEKVVNLGINDRVLFHKAVLHEILWQYVGAADVGMVTVQNVCQSYYYMLPNKFFENIQSLTPIICSDFPEVSRITNEYGIGLTCDPADIADMNRQVEKMRTDREFYLRCKENLKKAKEELCWEKESEKLEEAMRRIYEKQSMDF